MFGLNWLNAPPPTLCLFRPFPPLKCPLHNFLQCSNRIPPIHPRPLCFIPAPHSSDRHRITGHKWMFRRSLFVRNAWVGWVGSVEHTKSKRLEKSPRPPEPKSCKNPENYCTYRSQPKSARAPKVNTLPTACARMVPKKGTPVIITPRNVLFHHFFISGILYLFDTHRVSEWVQGQPAESSDVNI